MTSKAFKTRLNLVMKRMLCACASQQPGKILVVGVCGKSRLGAVRGNAFGNAFRKAAQKSRADYFYELFESSWIILDASAVNSFMIRLTENL
ncbi:unnamed protein product [Brassica napus]|nr:unnamed protein product [Brassica napus]